MTLLFFYILLIYSNVSYLSLGLGGGNCDNSITRISIAWLVLSVFRSSQTIFDYACLLLRIRIFPTNLGVSGPQHLHRIYYASTVTGVKCYGLCSYLHIYRGQTTNETNDLCLLLLYAIFTIYHVSLYFAQVASYDHAKHLFLNYGIMEEGWPLHVTSSLIAGFFCAAFSAPFDNVKSRVMNQIGGQNLLSMRL